MSRLTLGVAVVGLGVGEQHARAYLRTGCCDITWLYDLDAARMRRLANELGAGSPAPTYETLLKDAGTNVVSIASYDDAHFSQVMAALEAEKDVFVEKPLCRSTTELRAIRRACAQTGRQLGSNLVLRAAPLYRWLRDAIQSGELGEIYAFDGEYLYGRIEKITNGWRKDVDDYSVMQGGGVHLVDLMLWLTGQRPESVTAVGNRICTRGTAFRYRDYVSAVYQFPSNLIGRITANFGCVHRHQHVVRIFGTKATFLHDDQGPRLHGSRGSDAAPLSIAAAPLPASKGDLIPEFVRRILERADARAGAEHEFNTIAACLAADEALAGGSRAKVDYV